MGLHFPGRNRLGREDRNDGLAVEQGGGQLPDFQGLGVGHFGHGQQRGGGGPVAGHGVQAGRDFDFQRRARPHVLREADGQ